MEKAVSHFASLSIHTNKQDEQNYDFFFYRLCVHIHWASIQQHPLSVPSVMFYWSRPLMHGRLGLGNVTVPSNNTALSTLKLFLKLHFWSTFIGLGKDPIFIPCHCAHKFFYSSLFIKPMWNYTSTHQMFIHTSHQWCSLWKTHLKRINISVYQLQQIRLHHKLLLQECVRISHNFSFL